MTMRTLAEITAALANNRSLRKGLGRGVMWELCAGCTLAACNSASSACPARQERTRRQRAYYAAHNRRLRKCARADYYRHYDDRRAKSKRYQSDPAMLAVLSVKRRAKYEARRLAEGRAVRPYRWTNPLKNKPKSQPSGATLQ